MLNKPPPTDYNQFLQIAKSIDSNYDGRINKQELFQVFKRFLGKWIFWRKIYISKNYIISYYATVKYKFIKQLIKYMAFFFIYD